MLIVSGIVKESYHLFLMIFPGSSVWEIMKLSERIFEMLCSQSQNFLNIYVSLQIPTFKSMPFFLLLLYELL